MFRTSFNADRSSRATTTPPTRRTRGCRNPTEHGRAARPHADPHCTPDLPADADAHDVDHSTIRSTTRIRRRRPDGKRHRRAADAPPDTPLDAIPDTTTIDCRIHTVDGVKAWTIESANTNSFQAGVDHIVNRTTADVTLLQEHRLLGDSTCASAIGRLRRSKWNAWLPPAWLSLIHI